MISKPSTQPDDEIDLLEVFVTLWRGKWLISGSVTLALVVGFIYTQLAIVNTTNYKLKVPYTFNMYSIGNERLCGNNISCLNEAELRRLKFIIGEKWNFESSNQMASFVSSSPLEVPYYENFLKEVENEYNEICIAEAKIELEIIEATESPRAGFEFFTKPINTNLINANRVIAAAKEGRSIVAFGKPIVDVTSIYSPRPFSIYVLSFVAGLIFGIVFVLIRGAFLRRNARISAS
jgi:hypothetical protein